MVDTRYPMGVATSGEVDGVLWWTRQLTGKPTVTRGYVEVDGRKMPCGHDHRKAERARSCARSLARALADAPRCPGPDASWSGVDQTALDDSEKVWRCDVCGAEGTADALNDPAAHKASRS